MVTNIPIIFVPGTSGSSLDTSIPFKHEFLGDIHRFPEVCEVCPLGTAIHTDKPFDYRPGPLDITKPWAFDPAGPRVWLGPEAVSYLVGDAEDANRGNHYLDVLQFDGSGHNTLFSQIGQGTVLQRINLVAGGIVSIPIYDSLINFLTNDPSGPRRPLNSGPNGLYLFPYDWRADLPDLAQQLGMFVDNIRSSHGVQKVVLLTHSLGGLVSRAYYLSSPSVASKVDQVISLSGGFGGIILPIKILTMGDTWGFGLGYGALTVGFAEWEVQAIAQNWGTAYFQVPSSDDWFYDDGAPFDRSYIRDEQSPVAHTHLASMGWLQLNHNAIITTRAESFFSASSPALGNFQTGTGTIPHHRIVSKGIMNTVVAVRIYTGTSDACQFAMQTGLPVNPAECVPITRYEPIHGDGDGTVSYHGLLARLAQNAAGAFTDDRVYVLDDPTNNDHVEHFAITTRPEVHSLIKALLDGTVTNQPQAQALVDARFHSPNDAVVAELA